MFIRLVRQTLQQNTATTGRQTDEMELTHDLSIVIPMPSLFRHHARSDA